MTERRRLGVLGWPVAHSRSPAIQNAALAAAGLHEWRYQLLPVPPELLSQLVPALPGAGFAGANVTIPHKQAALALAGQASPRARAIGAANTLTFGPDGEIAADNTDAPALIAALPFPISGRTAVVLGAGGSARAVVWALLDAGAGEVQVWNRTAERARELAEELGAVAVARPGPADLLVNCTAVGVDGSDPFDRLPLAPGDLAGYDCVVDLVYTVSGTVLVDRARARGVAAVDGLELLIGQGALSFEIFTGVPASVQAMRAAAS
ncbi:MAG TPA: shikimate dehydrogenase [Solirubrobacteraceae bacterium]|jgi:shikimate dehydrogenase|nr:shikimate dehydrogenase [Solirubrobacteraceae bacterium]